MIWSCCCCCWMTILRLTSVIRSLLSGSDIVHPNCGGRSSICQEVCRHLALPLDLDLPAAVELIGLGVLQDVEHVLRDLGEVRHPRRVHPGGHVDRVAPDVVLRFPCAYDPGHHGADVHANPEGEAVVRVLVDDGQLVPHAEDVLGELGDVVDGAEAAVLALVENLVLGDEADGGHVGGPDGLDLVEGAESVVADEIIEVGDDLVQEPQALDALVVEVQLHVELVEVGDGGEEDADTGVRLAVQFLRTTNSCSLLLFVDFGQRRER